MSDLTWLSPLAHRDMPEQEGVLIEIVDASDTGVIDLRLGEADAGGRATAAKVLGFALPEAPRTSAGDGNWSCLWMSTDQWLLVGPRGDVQASINRLSDALTGFSHALTDVSDMRAILRVRGDAVRPVLAKCMPIDVHTSEWAPGFVRRVTFGEIAAALHVRATGPDEVDILVFRSYADYALRWLEEAAETGRRLTLFAAEPPPAV